MYSFRVSHILSARGKTRTDETPTENASMYNLLPKNVNKEPCKAAKTCKTCDIAFCHFAYRTVVSYPQEIHKRFQYCVAKCDSVLVRCCLVKMGFNFSIFLLLLILEKVC